MTKRVVSPAFLALLLIGHGGIALAQDTSGGERSQVLVNGALAVPGAPADSDTVPAKYSARNDTSDRLPIAAFRLKHVTDDQRREIYRQLTGESSKLALSPGGGDDRYAMIGAEIPAEIVLRDLNPLPETVTAKFPELRGAAFLRSNGRLLVVDPTNRIVIGVLTGG